MRREPTAQGVIEVRGAARTPRHDLESYGRVDGHSGDIPARSRTRRSHYSGSRTFTVNDHEDQVLAKIANRDPLPDSRPKLC